MIKGFSITQVLGASGVTLSPSNVWNAAGTTFTGIQFNVTDTASSAGSMLLNLQVGGTSRFNVTKAGVIRFGASGTKTITESGDIVTFSDSVNAFAVLMAYRVRDSNASGQLGDTGLTNGSDTRVTVAAGNAVGWSDSTTAAGAVDLKLHRDAANTLAQRNGANAQAKRIYGTYTDASNYRRVAIAMTTGGVASIAPEGAGTGASGNVLHISGLPTSNPGAGILWNDAGTVKVGT